MMADESGPLRIEREVVDAPVRSLAPMKDALAVEQQREAGLNALAKMTDGEFANRLNSLRTGLDRFDMMMREVLTVGEGADADLRIIKGVEKPVLTLAGAEKICFVARLTPTFTVERTVDTHAPAEPMVRAIPAIHYQVRCDLHLGNSDGPVTAQGVGSCNSHERKYRWRYAEKFCPKCGVVGSVILSQWPAKGGPFKGQKPWVCLEKRGGCRAEFAPDDESITKQNAGLVENAEPFDLDNTLLKMAKKRAFVDATKTATASSGRVAVDLEEGQPGTPEAKHLFDAILAEAKKLGWSKLGDVFTVASGALKRTIKLRAELEKLPANDLAKVLAAMPHPNPTGDESDASIEQPLGADEEGEAPEDLA